MNRMKIYIKIIIKQINNLIKKKNIYKIKKQNIKIQKIELFKIKNKR